MLIATQSQNAKGTRNYFEQVLTRGDYFLGQEVSGRWHGNGAAVLEIGENAEVSKEHFNRLLDGKPPITGKQLAKR